MDEGIDKGRITTQKKKKKKKTWKRTWASIPIATSQYITQAKLHPKVQQNMIYCFLSQIYIYIYIYMTFYQCVFALLKIQFDNYASE